MMVTEGGDYNKNSDGLWLDAAFAAENNFKLHKKIRLSLNGSIIEKEITGLCYSPEYIYNAQGGELIPDHKDFGFAFVNHKYLENTILPPCNQLLITGKGNLEQTIKDVLGSRNFTVVLQKNHPSYSMIKDEITQHKEIGLIFAGVFLLIAALITVTTVHRLLQSQRMQAGILKALGFRKKQLYLHYVSHSTFVCLLGALAGWQAGYFTLPGLLYPLMEELYILPGLKPAVLKWSQMLPIACTVLCLLISLAVCRTYLNSNAARILYSNSAEKVYRELPFYGLRKKMSFYGQWNIRDIFRNRLRSLVTVCGVVGCVSLLLASLGLYTSMENMSKWNFDKVQTFETKVTGDFTDEQYKKDLLEDMYGEELMEAAIDLKFKNMEKTASFTGIESQDYLRLYDSKGNHVSLDTGIALSRNIAREMNIEAGDRVKWRFAGQEKWYVSIVSRIIRTPMPQGITMMKEEMEKKRIPFRPTSIIGEKPENMKLDSIYTASAQSKADMKAGLNTMLNASVMLSALFLIMAVLLGSVILYNLGILSYMERYRDMATLKVLGFDNKRIRRLMVQQNLWLTALGIILGLPAGCGLIIAMLGTIQESIDMSAHTPFYVYAASILGTFILSWLINKALSRKVASIDMVSALKINE